MKIYPNHSFTQHLPADSIKDNFTRRVQNTAFSFVNPTGGTNHQLVHISKNLASLIGVSESEILSDFWQNILSGNTVHPKTKPFAMAYAGHQFGHWAGQLGDGRAINLFELEHNKKKWTVQLKGAGPTPYSRSGDGFAVLRSSVREYICSEAMYALGIPTTRALSLLKTGKDVLRDMFYNGNAAYEQGAVICRVSPSFIRFGNFELFAAQKDVKNLQKLANYCIPFYNSQNDKESTNKYVQLFKNILKKTIQLVVEWQRVGFVHGVLNTDNMSIIGETIDYGPYGWLEGFDNKWTPNTTDAQTLRYTFGNQPSVVYWNLMKLANTFTLLVEDPSKLQEILNNFTPTFEEKYLKMMCLKLGITNPTKKDSQLIKQLKFCLSLSEIDMTLFFRMLTCFNPKKPILHLTTLKKALYKIEDFEKIKNDWIQWFEIYAQRLKSNEMSSKKRYEIMNKVNPKYVFRNYMAQRVIEGAEKGNFSLFNQIFQLLQKPYDEQPEHEELWFKKRPEWARNKPGSSMLSCSS